MSDDNEEYERSRDEANRLADMETQLEPGLAEPAPAGFVAERDVDWDKVQHLIFSDGAPEARAAIRAGELRWALSGFDRQGWGSVSVFRADNGEEVAGARVPLVGDREARRHRTVVAVAYWPSLRVR